MELAEITAKLIVKMNNIAMLLTIHLRGFSGKVEDVYIFNEKLIEKVKSDCVAHISSF